MESLLSKLPHVGIVHEAAWIDHRQQARTNPTHEGLYMKLTLGKDKPGSCRAAHEAP